MDKKIIAKINSFSEQFANLSDEDLKKEAEEFKESFQKVKISNKLISKNMPKAISLVKEATKRALYMEYFDSQILSGIELCKNSIVELHPGEGKSLAIHIPAYIKYLSGRKVHIMVENDFLLQRDFHKANKIFSYLGVKIGAIVSKWAPEYELIDKKQAYESAITYVHPVEAGFDYLKSISKDYVHNADVIVDDIDRIIATQEPTSVVLVQPETKDLDNILLVDLIKEYNEISGIADFAIKQKKFYKKYLNKKVVLIPDNVQSQMSELPVNISTTKEEKFDKILEEVLEVHKYRCPVIIAIPNEDELEFMTKRLDKKGFIYKVVNGKNLLKDAFNLSQAGRLNSVTIVTKASGVDIPLGGDAYYLALDQLDRLEIPQGSELWRKEWRNAYEYSKKITEYEYNTAKGLGGIYEIITEHTNKDDIFKFYSARRGEKGSVKFFISFEDKFFKDISTNNSGKIINYLNMNKDKFLKNNAAKDFLINFAKYLNNKNDRLVK